MTIDNQLKICETTTKGPWISSNNAIPWKPTQRSDFADQGASIYAINKHNNIDIVIGGAQDEQGGAVGFLRNEDATFTVTAHTHYPGALRGYKSIQSLIERLRALITDPSHLAIVDMFDDRLKKFENEEFND